MTVIPVANSLIDESESAVKLARYAIRGNLDERICQSIPLPPCHRRAPLLRLSHNTQD